MNLSVSLTLVPRNLICVSSLQVTMGLGSYRDSLEAVLVFSTGATLATGTQAKEAHGMAAFTRRHLPTGRVLSLPGSELW
eukprot:SAG31_NODE_1542_length_7951_cov_4.038844_1_plen_79_part_10